MNDKKHLFVLLILIVFFLGQLSNVTAQEEIPKSDRLVWFKDAKLGIFIHWGIYSVNGIDESWSFYNGYISYEDYLKQLDGFTAENYDPDYWAKLIWNPNVMAMLEIYFNAYYLQFRTISFHILAWPLFVRMRAIWTHPFGIWNALLKQSQAIQPLKRN